MPEISHAVDDVFGVSRDVPLNYVARDAVDGKLIDSLTRTHHIVIYGSSKQGKTCLRKHCLSPEDYITVSCQNRWKLSDLHAAILKRAGYEVKQSTTHAVGGHFKIAASAGGGINIPFVAKGEAKMEGEGQANIEQAINKTELELDPLDANDIIRALDEINFRKYVAIEDFHYLPDETQRDFSFALKTFHEQSEISFIITGVWREQNRLIAFNGDLTERVFSVDVDTWKKADLRKVIDAGANLMGIEFSKDFIETVLDDCSESVHLAQEACRRACREADIFSTQEISRIIANKDSAKRILKEIVDEQTARYSGFIMNFSDGFQQTDLEMPKWIIYSILKSDISNLEKGLRLREISKLIKEAHPKGQSLNNGNITQALNSATSLQSNKGIRPIVIDYDATNRNLHVVDKGFLLWLARQDREELLSDLGVVEPS